MIRIHEKLCIVGQTQTLMRMLIFFPWKSFFHRVSNLCVQCRTFLWHWSLDRAAKDVNGYLTSQDFKRYSRKVWHSTEAELWTEAKKLWTEVSWNNLEKRLFNNFRVMDKCFRNNRHRRMPLKSTLTKPSLIHNFSGPAYYKLELL